MDFRVLGRVGVVVHGRELVLGATREAALLADLLVHANAIVPTSQLVDHLWASTPPPGAVATLHTYVRNLRRWLEPDRADGSPSRVLVTRRPGYVLAVEPEGLDAWRARRLIDEGRAALAVDDPVRGREHLTAALALWSGPAFGPLAAEGPLRTAAAELDELRLAATEDRVDADLALGRHGELCGELEGLVAQHPYRERFWAQLILALYRSGRQADALRAYQRVRRTLAEELGIEPSALLRNLELGVLVQEPDLDVGRPSDGGTRSHLLAVARQPSATTSFVGRTAELAQTAALLASRDVRLVTITGPAGVGKTRLGLRAAVEAEPGFPGGAWFVSLGSVTTPAAVGDVVLAALRGARQPGEVALDALAELGRGRHLLVVLDNCEHVLDAAARCAETLVSAGDSVVVATSRQPLGVAGEHVVPLAGLAPDAAAQLFIDRARACDPTFLPDGELVAGIGARLDQLPLAIELAAARVPAMSLADIAHHLTDRFRLLRGRTRDTSARHRTLHAAVDWSVSLLEPSLRDVFLRLSVFGGSFLSDAVMAVCAPDTIDDFDALDALEELVLRSLVVADRTGPTTRYALLETMREFGRARLAADGRIDECRARHARHYLVLVEHLRRQLATPESGRVMALFDREWDNIRSAFHWYAEAGEVDGAFRLVLAANPYATEKLQLELHSWAEQAIALAAASAHPLWPAAAGTAAALRLSVGDLDGARALAQEAMAQERRQGEPTRVEPRLAMAVCAFAAGDLEALRQHLPELERLAAACGDVCDAELAWYLRMVADLPTRGAALVPVVAEHVRAAEARGNPLECACAHLVHLMVTLATDRSQAPGVFDRAQRWAELAGSRMIAANCTFLMLTGMPSEDPYETLAFARRCLVDQYRVYGATIPLVRALIALARPESAAVLLGGLSRAPAGGVSVDEVAAEAVPLLTGALGRDYARLRWEGEQLSRDELAQRALEAIDEVLAPVHA